MNTEAAAFDAVADSYDATFTHTTLGRMLRARVWETLADTIAAGDDVLELACGTGEDAVWLAQQGVRVFATDGSGEMVRVAAAKAQQAGLVDRVSVGQFSLQDVVSGRLASSLPPERRFDGVFSNFGGLNTIDDWHDLARGLGALVRMGGAAVLVVMGPLCPWEVGWHALHGEPRTATRRWRSPAAATIGGGTIPVWYPSARRMRRMFAPWFRPVRVESLGLWLPPSHLAHLVVRWPRVFAALDRFERATARATAGWGDHYIMVLERTG